MRRATRVLTIVSVAQMVSVINASAMTVLAPVAALDLGADLPTAQWFVLGAFLSIAAFLVPAGRMGDLIGRKPLFVAGFALFMLGNLLCATATSAGMLIAARVVVGIGAAFQQGNSLPLLMLVFPGDRRASVIAMQVSVVGIGGVLGPLLGGLIIDAYGWRSLFWISTLLAGLMMLISAFGLMRRADRPPAAWSAFDWGGAALSAAFLVTLLASLTFAPRRGWTDPVLLAGFGLSAVLLVAFVRRELRVAEPMLPMSLWRISAIAVGTASSLALFMCASSMRFLIPYHLQFVQGFGPREVGFALVPAALALIVVAPLAGRLADSLGPRVANGGLFLVLIAMGFLASVGVDTPFALTTFSVMLVGVAMSFFHAPNGAAMINAVGPEKHGVTSGLLALSRNVGNVLGIALATAIVITVMSMAGVPATLEPQELASDPVRQATFVRGMRTAFVAFSALVLAMFVISAITHRRAQHAEAS